MRPRRPPREELAHEVEDGVDQAPGDIAADRAVDERARFLFAVTGREAGTEGEGQHHDQPEQDFAEAVLRIEQRTCFGRGLAIGLDLLSLVQGDAGQI